MFSVMMMHPVTLATRQAHWYPMAVDALEGGMTSYMVTETQETPLHNQASMSASQESTYRIIEAISIFFFP